MSTFGLTPTLRTCLIAIQELQARGLRPTLAELSVELGLASAGSLVDRLKALEERGWITRASTYPHAITVIAPIAEADEPQVIGLFDPPPDLAAELADAARRYSEPQAQGSAP